jgi:hypothetical protein
MSTLSRDEAGLLNRVTLTANEQRDAPGTRSFMPIGINMNQQLPDLTAGKRGSHLRRSEGHGSNDRASITITLHHSEISLLTLFSSFSKNHYSSRRLRLAKMNNHKWNKRRLVGLASKAQKKLDVSILPDLLDSLLIAQAKTHLDDQRAIAISIDFARAPVESLN